MSSSNPTPFSALGYGPLRNEDKFRHIKFLAVGAERTSLLRISPQTYRICIAILYGEYTFQSYNTRGFAESFICSSILTNHPKDSILLENARLIKKATFGVPVNVLTYQSSPEQFLSFICDTMTGL